MSTQTRVLSVTVATDDANALREVGMMFNRLSASCGAATPQDDACVKGGEIESGAQPGVPSGLAAQAFAANPNGPGVDVAAGLAAGGVIEQGAQDHLHNAAGEGAATSAGAADPGAAAHGAAALAALASAAAGPGAGAALPAVELDKAGMPWDGRINTSNKAKKADGTWKRAPGLEDAFVEGVKAELKQVMAAQVPAGAADPGAAAAGAGPVIPGVPAGPVAGIPSPPAGAAGAGPAIPPVPGAGAQDQAGIAAAGSAAAPTSYPELLLVVTQNIGAGKTTAEEVNGLCALRGVASLSLMSARPDLIPTVYADLQALLSTKA